MDWADIASKCNTTTGAASKRFSRMKQAFEADAAPPGASSPSSPVKNTPNKAKATPKRMKATTDNDNDISTTPVPRLRKRASPTKKTPTAVEEQKFKADPDDDGSDEEQAPKRAKTAKVKVTPKPKPKANGAANKNKEADLLTPTTEATTFIKGEDDSEGDEHEHGTSYDAQEPVEDLGEADGKLGADARKSLSRPFFPLSSSSFPSCPSFYTHTIH